MVKLRLKRMGKKRSAFYRIVAADALAPSSGRIIQELGYFNPHSKELKINHELALKWLNDGAIPTPTVKSLFKKEKINAKFEDYKNTLKK